MKKVDAIKNKFLEKGMKEKNIDYAIDAVKYNVKRELIIEHLTSKFRNELPEVSNLLLNDIYEANGGEFKHENRSGLFFGIFLLIVGILGLLHYIYFVQIDLAGRHIGLIVLIIFFALTMIIKGVLKKYKTDVWDSFE